MSKANPERERMVRRSAQLKMIDEFQCGGCMFGPDPHECSELELVEVADGKATSFKCERHHPATVMFPGGPIYLGLPKGFNKVGFRYIDRAGSDFDMKGTSRIRLWLAGEQPTWNRFNIAVWAMEKEGYLFVRTMSPRINFTYVDVITGGTWGLFLGQDRDQPVDVATFIDEID